MALATKNTSAQRMTLRIPAPLLARLNDCHKKMEISKTQIINEALQSYLDELEEDARDAEIAAAAWREFEASGEKGISLEELREKLGV